VFGTVLAISFAAAAVGAMGATALRRLLRGSTRVTCAVLTLLGAAAIALLAGPDVLGVAAVGFAAYYVAHGSTWPLLSAVLHSRVTTAHRATAVSAMSLAMMLGGIAGNVGVSWLATRFGEDAAFLTVAAVLLLGALACLRLPPSAPAEVPAEAADAPAGVV
jgi:MFS family permease